MISLYTLQRFVHFSPQDSNTSMVGDSRHNLSEALTLYFRQTVPPTTQYICQSTSSRASRNLLNYARAHNGLWLHTEVSSTNNLMIPLSLGGGHRRITRYNPGISQDNTGITPGAQNQQSTQMCIKVGTLEFEPLINKLTSIMDTLKPNPRLLAQHSVISITQK